MSSATATIQNTPSFVPTMSLTNSFSRLVTLQRQRMVAYIQSVRVEDFPLTLNRMDAEEAYNDACCALWCKLQQGKVVYNPKSIVGYLKKTCRFTALHYLRNMDLGVSFDEFLERCIAKGSHEDLFLDVAGEESAQREHGMELLDELLSRLSETERLLLHLYYWDDLSMNEIARRTGFKNAYTAKNKKCKLIQKLRQWMHDELVKRGGKSYLLAA